MTTQTVSILEDKLQRDVAILSTLAHLHYATIQQIHALCFPYRTVATARMTLHYLAEANFVAHSNWRVRRLVYYHGQGQVMSREHGQVWTLTAKGNDLLQRYVPRVPPLARIDLARPCSAVEHEEWRVRLHVRTLLVRLLLEARATAVLNCVEVQLPWNASWPTAWGSVPFPEPDALIAVVWQPAERLPADWLPWLAPGPTPSGAVRYPIYLERAHAQTNVSEALPTWAQLWPTPGHIPVLILQDEDRYASTCEQLASVHHTLPLRLSTWTALEAGLAQEQWRDERGVPCGLCPCLPSGVC